MSKDNDKAPGRIATAWPEASVDTGREPWQYAEYTRMTCHCGEEIYAMHFSDECVWYHSATADDECGPRRNS